MEKEQYQSVIRFLFLEGKSRSEIKERLDVVYDESSLSMATVKNWFNEFQRGRTSVFDEPHPGVPKMATTEDNVTKIHDLRNPKEFLRRFVTVDETWIHWYTPETKKQSKQWISPGERAPKKAKTALLAGKVMATVFWDSQGVIYIDYLEKGKTVTGLYYAELLD
ncbi:PREDICTED: histone-lysine N-methyltransferase SETMAR-like [Dinoponera quadriceps]|uniref:Histone-lysine N-methyltransferase SETMAR-like n=1 Tax=Dinoponera quadriceps TaxID=609295 RepID=A0A6P3Y8G7_DINQU|nr:PREDICTED: histone-lysine N-methyltransferase SETMAR-like [Dinoponera quadriceps]